MDSPRLDHEISIESTRNDSCMIRLPSMQIDEVFTIQGHDGTRIAYGIRKYVFVGYRLLCSPRVLNSEDIVT